MSQLAEPGREMSVGPTPVKLILTYDPRPESGEAYFEYVLGEFVPSLKQHGLRMAEAWHTAYGSYPLRLSTFVAPDLGTLESILTSDSFLSLESRLLEFVDNYRRRVVEARVGFQF
jgi:hypothetical protein